MLRVAIDILNILVRVILAIPEPSTITPRTIARHIHSVEREFEFNRVRSLGISMRSDGNLTCYLIGFCVDLICPPSYALLFLSFIEETPLLCDSGVLAGWYTRGMNSFHDQIVFRVQGSLACCLEVL
jgi:hypothetical protein